MARLHRAIAFIPRPGGAEGMVVAGVLLMLFGDFMFALNDALGKWLVASFSVGRQTTCEKFSSSTDRPTAFALSFRFSISGFERERSMAGVNRKSALRTAKLRPSPEPAALMFGGRSPCQGFGLP